ncbi:MAG: hypothetical protein ACD_60C00024G0017 [uncultured bacterium]|nr:MAG: hypothetical protein ACD_60C00024G0017 [uncultured bacterium]
MQNRKEIQEKMKHFSFEELLEEEGVNYQALLQGAIFLNRLDMVRRLLEEESIDLSKIDRQIGLTPLGEALYYFNEENKEENKVYPNQYFDPDIIIDLIDAHQDFQNISAELELFIGNPSFREKLIELFRNKLNEGDFFNKRHQGLYFYLYYFCKKLPCDFLSGIEWLFGLYRNIDDPFLALEYLDRLGKNDIQDVYPIKILAYFFAAKKVKFSAMKDWYINSAILAYQELQKAGVDNHDIKLFFGLLALSKKPQQKRSFIAILLNSPHLKQKMMDEECYQEVMDQANRFPQLFPDFCRAIVLCDPKKMDVIYGQLIDYVYNQNDEIELSQRIDSFFAAAEIIEQRESIIDAADLYKDIMYFGVLEKNIFCVKKSMDRLISLREQYDLSASVNVSRRVERVLHFGDDCMNHLKDRFSPLLIEADYLPAVVNRINQLNRSAFFCSVRAFLYLYTKILLITADFDRVTKDKVSKIRKEAKKYIEKWAENTDDLYGYRTLARWFKNIIKSRRTMEDREGVLRKPDLFIITSAKTVDQPELRRNINEAIRRSLMLMDITTWIKEQEEDLKPIDPIDLRRKPKKAVVIELKAELSHEEKRPERPISPIAQMNRFYQKPNQEVRDQQGKEEKGLIKKSNNFRY